MVNGLFDNLDLLTLLPCKYPLGLPALLHTFCSEFYDMCKFLVLSDFLVFGGDGGGLIKRAEYPTWGAPLDREDTQRQPRQ